MKIAKIFSPKTLNAILPWNFPVKYLPFLFCCVLINYDQSFLSFPRSFLKSFSIDLLGYALSQCSKCHPKIFYFPQHLKHHLVLPPFHWFLHKPLSDQNFLLVSSYLSTSCKRPWIQFLNHSFQSFSFHFVSFILFAFCSQCQFLLRFPFQKADLFS